MSKALDQ